MQKLTVTARGMTNFGREFLEDVKVPQIRSEKNRWLLKLVSKRTGVGLFQLTVGPNVGRGAFAFSRVGEVSMYRSNAWSKSLYFWCKGMLSDLGLKPNNVYATVCGDYIAIGTRDKIRQIEKSQHTSAA